MSVRFSVVAGGAFFACVSVSGLCLAAAFRSHVRAISPLPEPSVSVSAPKPVAPPPPPPVATPSAPAPDPCRALFEQQKLDEAEKTCNHALDQEKDPDVRAHLYATLGLVEEKRGSKKNAEHELLTSLLYGYSDDAGDALGRVSTWKAEARPGKAPIGGKGKAATGTVRKEPSKTSAKVESIPTGTEVTTIAAVTSKSGTWVSVAAGGDKRGWVSEALVSHGAKAE